MKQNEVVLDVYVFDRAQTMENQRETNMLEFMVITSGHSNSSLWNDSLL